MVQPLFVTTYSSLVSQSHSLLFLSPLHRFIWRYWLPIWEEDIKGIDAAKIRASHSLYTPLILCFLGGWATRQMDTAAVGMIGG